MYGTFENFSNRLFDDFFGRNWAMDQYFENVPWLTGLRAVRPGTFPPLNVGVSPDTVDVYLFAAGLDRDSIDVSLNGNLLTLAGDRSAPESTNGNSYRRERFAGSFRRVVTLPEDVDPERVDAKYRDGVLHVSVHRKESAKPRQIEVH